MDDDQTFLFLLATLWFAQALWVLFDVSETKKRLPVAIAWGLFDGENILFQHLIGAAIILLGVYLVNKKEITL